MPKAVYEIRAMGEVPDAMLEDFDGVTVSFNPAGTTIHAVLADEAELHGLLDALRRGNILLVDVRREVSEGMDGGDAAVERPPPGPPPEVERR